MTTVLKISSGNILDGTENDETLKNILINMATKLSFDPAEWKSLGLQDSHKYREQFLALAEKKKLTASQIFYVIMAAVAVKNRDRIMKALGSSTANADIVKVVSFIKDECVQYVPQSSINKFPVVKIPESFPSIALVASIYIWGSDSDSDRVPVVKKIKEQLFFAQMKLSAQMQAEHEVWERDVFWGTAENTGLVKSSKFDKRPAAVKLEFQKTFYDTKAADEYPFLNVDGTLMNFTAAEPTEDELWEYIKAVTAHRNTIK
jgi:hypothetical protein